MQEYVLSAVAKPSRVYPSTVFTVDKINLCADMADCPRYKVAGKTQRLNNVWKWERFTLLHVLAS